MPIAVVASETFTTEAFFFGLDGAEMFGCSYMPGGIPRAGVVICSSIEGEMHRTWRREILLANALASKGFAVQRFEYRGFGNSYGRPEDTTYTTMCEDALHAAACLTERAHVSDLAFVGVRMGAIASAVASGAFSARPLALWEPIVDADQYFREMFRRRLMQDLKTATRRQVLPSEGAMLREMAHIGYVDVGGNRIFQRLHESFAHRTLLDVIGDLTRPVLLATLGMSEALPTYYKDLTEHWLGLGFPLETLVIKDELDWWFPSREWTPDEKIPGSRQLIDGTVSWFQQVFRSVGSTV